MNTKNNKNGVIKIAVNGVNGRLGSHLVSMGCIPMCADILDPRIVKQELEDIDPDVLIHCAGFTKVDECEMTLSTQISRVNGTAVGVIRNYLRGRMIYISTDYIFDGKNGPYSEYSPPNPINHYGASKLFGEEVLKDFDFHYDTIVRTTILYGSKCKKPDFVTQVLQSLRNNQSIELPATLFGSPTYIPHLAEALLHIAHMKEPPKVINIAGAGVFSRYEFGIMIANIFGCDNNLIRYTRRSVGIANRPRRAGLKVDLAKKLKIPIYEVHEGLREMKHEYRTNQSN